MAMFDRLFGGKRKRDQPKSASALEADALRDTIIRETEDEVPRFKALADSVPVAQNGELGGQGWHAFGEAVRDVARAAYSFDEPTVRKRGDMLTSHLFNREVVNQVVQSPEFQAARMHTAGNAVESLFSTIALGDVMHKHAKLAGEHLERSEEADIEETAERLAQEKIDALREQAKQLQPDGEEIKNVGAQMKQAIAQREKAKQVQAELAQQHANSNATAVAAAIAQEAAGKMSEAAQMIGSLPGLGAGSDAGIPPEQQVKLAEAWMGNERLRKIALMVGRLSRDMRFKRQARTKNVNVEPVGITTGRDIGRMLPHELARAFMPDLRPTFIKDFSERSLLQYKMSGKERAGKGPIVYVMDGSGSMQVQDKIVWAQSLCLALLGIAQREKRAFCGVQFSSAGQLASWVFPARRKPDPEQVLAMASKFFHGGTSIYQGLNRALEIIKDAGEFKTADIVLATDGIAPFGEEDQRVVRELREMGVRIHGINILGADENRYLKQACEWQCRIEDLAGSNEATDALAQQLT